MINTNNYRALSWLHTHWQYSHGAARRDYRAQFWELEHELWETDRATWYHFWWHGPAPDIVKQVTQESA
jgi:hypothetical protein